MTICAILSLSVPSRGSCDPPEWSAPVHSAGSQLPLCVLGRDKIVAAGDDSTPLRSEIML